MDAEMQNLLEQTGETWRLVELKLEELKNITNDSWNNQDWEMATLGERTIRTTLTAMRNAKEMFEQMARLNASVASLRDTVNQKIPDL